MTNEYIVYWRREVLYRTKVIAESEEGALDRVMNGFSTDSQYEEDIDEYGDMEIDNIDMIEKDVENPDQATYQGLGPDSNNQLDCLASQSIIAPTNEASLVQPQKGQRNEKPIRPISQLIVRNTWM